MRILYQTLLILLFNNLLSAQDEIKPNFKTPERVYYINLRDFIDVTSAFSLGMQIPISEHRIFDSQLGFMNPYTNLLNIFRFNGKGPILNNGFDYLTFNRYGGKVSEEIKFLYGHHDNNTKFHGLQFTYQYERSEAELNYRRFNRYNQLLPTKWIYQTVSLFYKIGKLIYFPKDKMMLEMAIGTGIEYKQDNNSVYAEYKDVELIKRNIFSIYTLPINEKTFSPNLVVSLKLGIY
ncbi:MAG: hypothetical protein ABIO44_13860 [Saprospiraceae bacterium]